MYVDVRRKLVFFDQGDHGLSVPALRAYDAGKGTFSAVSGAQDDDGVQHVARDGQTLALSSVKWISVRNANRNRLSFIGQGLVQQQSDRYMSFWTRLDPTGRYALISTFNGKGRPVVLDLQSGEFSDPIARDLDARFGDIDPLAGQLWAPDERARNSVLLADCRSGEISKRKFTIDGKATRLRFAHDGGVVYIESDNGTLYCFDREAVKVWQCDVSVIGPLRSASLFMNESGSHLCLPISETERSNWGEDVVIDARSGVIERSHIRHRGPPARLASDWFGDQLLTHTGEIMDFFTGEQRGSLTV